MFEMLIVMSIVILICVGIELTGSGSVERVSRMGM
jgi:hypothetical protein